MKKLLPLLAVVSLTAAIAFGIAGRVNADMGNDPSDIVGVWEVTAIAPYAPHLFTFNADGTMLSTNPTDVQENSSKPGGGTNDSLGMGVWHMQKINDARYIVGTFEELNAAANTHQPADKLSVSFKVKMTSDGNGFDGPASATVGSETDPSHLTGMRVTVNQSAIDQL